jgi:hypothetical protein
VPLKVGRDALVSYFLLAGMQLYCSGVQQPSWTMHGRVPRWKAYRSLILWYVDATGTRPELPTTGLLESEKINFFVLFKKLLLGSFLFLTVKPCLNNAFSMSPRG